MTLLDQIIAFFSGDPEGPQHRWMFRYKNVLSILLYSHVVSFKITYQNIIRKTISAAVTYQDMQLRPFAYITLWCVYTVNIYRMCLSMFIWFLRKPDSAFQSVRQIQLSLFSWYTIRGISLFHCHLLSHWLAGTDFLCILGLFPGFISILSFMNPNCVYSVGGILHWFARNPCLLLIVQVFFFSYFKWKEGKYFVTLSEMLISIKIVLKFLRSLMNMSIHLPTCKMVFIWSMLNSNASSWSSDHEKIRCFLFIWIASFTKWRNTLFFWFYLTLSIIGNSFPTWYRRSSESGENP